MANSSRAVFPARSPRPFTVVLTKRAPALIPAIALAVAIPKSLWVCISMSMPVASITVLTFMKALKGSRIPKVSQKRRRSAPASRADMEFLLSFARTARDAGADRLRFCDTLGILDPFNAFMKVKTVMDATGMDIEMHTHNDFGMATANAIAGIKAGARFVNTTVNGLGERAGNTALEELAMALYYLENIDVELDTGKFRELSEYVAQASSRPIPAWKHIVGANLFVYENEKRAAAVLRDPENYEIFPPESVGLQRRFILGKYSGTSVLKMKLADLDLELTEEEAAVLGGHVRSRSVALKRSLFDEELLDLYREEIGMVRDEVNQLLSEGRDVVADGVVDSLADLSEVSDDSKIGWNRPAQGGEGQAF